MENYFKTDKFTGAEIVDLTEDDDISKSKFRSSVVNVGDQKTTIEISDDDSDTTSNIASYHMSAKDVMQDEPIKQRHILPLRPARSSILQEEAEGDIPVFYIEDDDEDETDDDRIRELSSSELEDLQARLAHRARSTTSSEYQNSATTPIGLIIEPGMNVELEDGDFLKIKHLVRGKDRNVEVKGILLRRTRKLYNTLPKKYNELCAIIKASDDGTGDPAIDDYLVTRSLFEIVAERKIMFTNQLFPACSFRVKSKIYRDEQEVMETAELVCRWKHIEFCDMVERGVSAKSWIRLREAESDHGEGVPDADLMQAWRGDDDEVEMSSSNTSSTATNNIKKRETSDNISVEGPVDLTATDSDNDVEEVTETLTRTSIKRVNRRGIFERRSSTVTTERFTTAASLPICSKSSSSSSTPGPRIITHGDLFCGAGGATRAAERAGLTVTFVLDHDEDSCSSQSENFPNARKLKMGIFRFLTMMRDKPWMRVTVLHISFPCQYYSAAHTIEGKNDPDNVAAGYSVIPILKKCRPRIVTLEQTSNMVNGHPESFQALIQQFTECGYSVSAKIVNFAEYGNVQPRKRLFIYASCPGQLLPSFPKPTHGPRPGQKRFTTIRDVLGRVSASIKPHMAQFTSKKKAPYNADQILRSCITTSGGEGDLHPGGKRSFNLQELAQMGGFPAKHKFVGNKTSIRKQIGNAVPAIAATPFFEEVVKSIKQFDEETSTQRSEVRSVPSKKFRHSDIIDLD